ncbi:MAG: hypothetical protein ACI856_001630 [Kiritimatiellia bacterium]|jgi:hypothetical protein
MEQHITFIETKIFTKRIAGLIGDGAFAELQAELAQNPEKGPVIEGTGGLRKVRWKREGQGKSGGIRIMYLFLRLHGIIHLVFVFAKSDSDNLTADEKKQLKKIVDAIKREYQK